MHPDGEVDERFMRRALDLAYKQLGNVSPNPSVGCVIVKDGEIIAEGVTQPPGGDHAEIVALAKAGEKARGATLYVTLEPCCHEEKRTPPCTHAIADAGIARTVIATHDPNPAVSGKGEKVLASTGMAVDVGLLGEEARRCHEFYAKWITQRVPFVTLKIAMTLDGKLSWGDGKRKQITGDEARGRSHLWRAQNDAIMVGVETVLSDDPQLTTRLCEGRHPVRIVIDSRLRMPPSAALLRQPGRTVVFTTQARNAERHAELSTLCDVVIVGDADGRCDLAEVLAVLGELGITSVIVEGGPRLAASLIDSRLVDKARIFLAPFTRPDGIAALGSVKEAFSLADISIEKVGDDILISGYF